MPRHIGLPFSNDSRQVVPPEEHRRLLSVEQTKDLLAKEPTSQELHRWERTVRDRIQCGRGIPIFLPKARMTFRQAHEVRQSIWTQKFLKGMNDLMTSAATSTKTSDEQRGYIQALEDSQDDEAEIGRERK